MAAELHTGVAAGIGAGVRAGVTAKGATGAITGGAAAAGTGWAGVVVREARGRAATLTRAGAGTGAAALAAAAQPGRRHVPAARTGHAAAGAAAAAPAGAIWTASVCPGAANGARDRWTRQMPLQHMTAGRWAAGTPTATASKGRSGTSKHDLEAYTGLANVLSAATAR